MLNYHNHQDRIYFINDDCFSKQWDSFLETLPGGIDLVLTDPPFNIADKGKVTKTHGKIYSNKEAWGTIFKDSFTPDEYDDFIRRFLERVFPILNVGGSLFCFIDRKYAGKFTEIAEGIGFLYKNQITFVKTNCVPKVRATNFGSATEIAVWLIKPNSGKTSGGSKVAKTKPKIFNNAKAVKGLRHPDGEHNVVAYHNSHSSNVFFYTIGSKTTGHPCEKYDGEIKPIIETLSQPGSWILDTFAGGFNIGLCAQRLGRRYVGFEIDQAWYDKGVSFLKPVK